MLGLFDYKSIESLQTMISQLQHFTELCLIGCENLKEKFQNIVNISSLSMLGLSLCMSIELLLTMIG
jgi:hypothetical protein